MTREQALDVEMNFANVTRKFTVLTLRIVQALELPIAEVVKIQHEFPSVARRLYLTFEEELEHLLERRFRLQAKLDSLITSGVH